MKNSYWILAVVVIFFFSCKNTPNEDVETSTFVPLKEAMKGKFTFGTAINKGQIYQEDAATDSIIKTHFNSIVAENVMKGERIHPTKDEFFWDDADRFVAYGIENNMEIIGHTLAWHSQAPPWYFTDDEGQEVSREELINRMTEHITTIMLRYDGKVKGWDVVNEAVNDDGTMRESKYYQIIGPDWVEIAFQIANDSGSKAELYYNDYNASNPEKRAGIIRLVKSIQDKGIRVDGIGMQGHVNVDSPSLQDFEESIKAYAELGHVMITEMDVTVLPWPSQNVTADVSLSAEYQESMNPYKDGLSDSMSIVLNNRFLDFFKLYNKHSDKIQRVTMWGVNDAQTWRNEWPIKGRRDYPLLFNRDNTAKPVVDSIIVAFNK